MTHIPSSVLQELEQLKHEWKYNDALRIANNYLSRDPHDDEALLQVADVYYRQWSLEQAEKAITFYNDMKNYKDPMGLYIQGVLEMEKNAWYKAKKVLKKAMELTDFANHEIVRCYGLSEYWYGNRERGVDLLEQALEIHEFDAEIMYNLIELYLLERQFRKADKLIQHYLRHREKVTVVEKDKSFYDNKIQIFQKFLEYYRKYKA